jgi:RNA polymerase sigma-70 factor (ECF subfamily)
VNFIDPEDDLEFMADPPEPELETQKKDRVELILAALPDRYRRILELRFLESSPIKESARIMDVTVANAKVLQHRALQMATKVAEELELAP